MNKIENKKWADYSDDEDDKISTISEKSIKYINDQHTVSHIPSPVLSAISTNDTVNAVIPIKYKRCPLIDTINGCPYKTKNDTICPITEGIHPTRLCSKGSNCKYIIYDHNGNVKKINCTFLHPEINNIKHTICTFHEQKRCNFSDTCCHSIHIPHHISYFNKNLFKKLL